MENKWTALSESLPPDSNDVMIKSTEWETEYNELGIRIGFPLDIVTGKQIGRAHV